MPKPRAKRWRGLSRAPERAAHATGHAQESDTWVTSATARRLRAKGGKTAGRPGRKGRAGWVPPRPSHPSRPLRKPLPAQWPIGRISPRRRPLPLPLRGPLNKFERNWRAGSQAVRKPRCLAVNF